MIPESFRGSDGNSEAIFTLSQGPGSVGSTTCVDSSIRGSGTAGGLKINVFDRSDVVQASREYADEEITFTPAAVGLHLAAADYNLLEDVQVSLPQGDEQIFVKDGTDTGDNITGNHIYNFLEARRWFFGNSGNGDALSSYIIARGSSGSLNPRVLTPSWLDHYFTDNQAPISQTFFIKPTQVNDTTTDITTREFSPHSVVAASSLADDGYDYAFFSNLTDYQVDGYLKFSSRPDLATNAYAVGGGDENAGAFARTFSTAGPTAGPTAGSTAGATSVPTSVNAYQPLIAIATAADSPTSGFGLKARLCRISIIAGSDNHISALSGKALSCDAATAQLLDATAAAKIISLADWTATDRIVKVGTLPTDATGGETCRSAGLVIYPLRASADNFSDNVFCGGTDVTGGALAVNYAGDSIHWSFQHYLGSRAIAPNAPESMSQSGIYLAEVYPVPTDNTDMSILLGAPIRVLFEVFAK
ncbi:MAG: hypothetical protein K0U41_04000 [Gammaproteobacteria bacterium]|nr:hypothetical protein [Gammaproteobacteria bacterium]